MTNNLKEKIILPLKVFEEFSSVDEQKKMYFNFKIYAVFYILLKVYFMHKLTKRLV